METVVKPSLSETAYYVKIGLLNVEQLVLLCEEKLKNKEENDRRLEESDVILK